MCITHLKTKGVSLVVAKTSHIPSTLKVGTYAVPSLFADRVLGVAHFVLLSILGLVHAAFKSTALFAQPCGPGHQLYFVYYHWDSISIPNSAVSPPTPWVTPKSMGGCAGVRRKSAWRSLDPLVLWQTKEFHILRDSGMCHSIWLGLNFLGMKTHCAHKPHFHYPFIIDAHLSGLSISAIVNYAAY